VILTFGELHYLDLDELRSVSTLKNKLSQPEQNYNEKLIGLLASNNNVTDHKRK